jgi:AraC family transcriptional regulator
MSRAVIVQIPVNSFFPVLRSGQYMGQEVRSFASDCCRLTLSRYAADSYFERHAHEHPGMFLLVRGAHRERDESREIEQMPMSFVWHPAATPHATWFGPAGALGLNISFREEALDGISLPDTRAIEASPRMQSCAIRLLASLFSARSPDPSDQDEFLLDQLSIYAPGAPERSRPAWLRKAVDLIHSEFQSDVGLSKVAARVGIHRIHLARTFRQFEGVSISTYVQLLRLNEARRLVLQRRSTIAEAAITAGFADQSHLARVAGRHFGVPLQRLRELAS